MIKHMTRAMAVGATAVLALGLVPADAHADRKGPKIRSASSGTVTVAHWAPICLVNGDTRHRLAVNNNDTVERTVRVDYIIDGVWTSTSPGIYSFKLDPGTRSIEKFDLTPSDTLDVEMLSAGKVIFAGTLVPDPAC